jgi:dephospho-CoA kinase
MGDQAKHPIIIGLTGNIGSGKSTVAAFLREMGYPVLDADLLSERARELKKAELKALFPEAFLGEELDRRRLAQLVFSDPQKLRALEELIHPEVRRLLEEELSRLEPPWSSWRSPSSLRRVGRKGFRAPSWWRPPWRSA